VWILLQLVRCVWYFFLLKILDYVETIVFVLRKKDNQISTLHLYHHVSTLLLTWVAVRYYASTVLSIVSLINSFIHAIMYTYYLLAAWGPKVQKAVAPIKRWLTISQMVNFLFLNILQYFSYYIILFLWIVSHVQLIIW